TASGPVPTRVYNRPGTYTPTLTVRDEWNASSEVFTLPAITITEPSGNVAPTAQIAFNCIALTCATSSAGSADPNAGDTISYLWDFGDGTATSTSSSPSHTYASPGPYTLTLTVTDGWGKYTTVTRVVTVSP
ncbi:MAG TPA: PKD domain-containing protein, partial [Actinomycetes bacterium]|nr:PKD domain-containing protein [Actinomycetes bacterium]